MDGIFRVNPMALHTADGNSELKPELVRSDIAEATGIAIVGQNVIALIIFLLNLLLKMYWTDRRLEKVFASTRCLKFYEIPNYLYLPVNQTKVHFYFLQVQ